MNGGITLKLLIISIITWAISFIFCNSGILGNNIEIGYYIQLFAFLSPTIYTIGSIAKQNHDHP